MVHESTRLDPHLGIGPTHSIVDHRATPMAVVALGIRRRVRTSLMAVYALVDWLNSALWVILGMAISAVLSLTFIVVRGLYQDYWPRPLEEWYFEPPHVARKKDG